MAGIKSNRKRHIPQYPYFRLWEGNWNGKPCKDLTLHYDWHFPTLINGSYAWEIDFGKFSIMLNHRHIH